VATNARALEGDQQLLPVLGRRDPEPAAVHHALRLFADPAEYPIFPFYTANQATRPRRPRPASPAATTSRTINSTCSSGCSRRCCATTHHCITAEDYKKLLYWNAWARSSAATRVARRQRVLVQLEPATPDHRRPSGIHHNILGSSNWTVIEDVAGLRPRTDNQVELSRSPSAGPLRGQQPALTATAT
jgi:hypothetical protein